LICDFLLGLFKSGTSTSSLNVARSAISFFSLNLLDITNNPILGRLFKYFYNTRPLRPRYLTYWPVAKLLNFLSEWHPIHNLTLRQLTLKTAALLALTTSDRGQTIHLLNIENTAISDNGISFVIFDKLKTTRRVLKPKVVECTNSEIPSLNVAEYLTAYLNKTFTLRAAQVRQGNPKPTQLFLSWATKKPVTRQTIARWLTTTLRLAGIDTTQFTAHSYRGAGLSAAHSRGASIDKIVASGNWKDAETFHSFYSAPDQDSSVGQIILRHFESGEGESL
jgi:hypothetical protein